MSTNYNEALLQVRLQAGKLLGKCNPKKKGKTMKETIYVGIDLARANSRVATLDSSGEAIFKPFDITNSREGIKKLLSKLSNYKKEQITCGMEISSNYWENMCSYLKEKDISPILLNPYQVKKYRQATGVKIKTDSIDAEAIASLICGRKYESLYIPDDAVLEFRELGENIIIKVPATVEGARAMEELTAKGCATIGTLCFSVEQYVLMAEAHRKGLKRTDKRPRCLIAMFTGVFERYIKEKMKQQNDLWISQEAIFFSGIHITKEALKICEERNYEAKILSAGITQPSQWIELVGPGHDAMTMDNKVAEILINNPPELSRCRKICHEL